jgi:hypothetical protein
MRRHAHDSKHAEIVSNGAAGGASSRSAAANAEIWKNDAIFCVNRLLRAFLLEKIRKDFTKSRIQNRMKFDRS